MIYQLHSIEAQEGGVLQGYIVVEIGVRTITRYSISNCAGQHDPALHVGAEVTRGKTKIGIELSAPLLHFGELACK